MNRLEAAIQTFILVFIGKLEAVTDTAWRWRGVVDGTLLETLSLRRGVGLTVAYTSSPLYTAIARKTLATEPGEGMREKGKRRKWLQRACRRVVDRQGNSLEIGVVWRLVGENTGRGN